MSLQTQAQQARGEKSSSSKTPTIASQGKAWSSPGVNPAHDYILHLQRTIGNRAVGRLLQSGFLQAKLNIGPANDKYEQEADTIAGKVVSMSGHQADSMASAGNGAGGQVQQISRTPLANSITPLQRQKAPEEEKLQKKSIEEDVQKAPAKEDEEAQGKFLRRKCATCEKEEAQAKIQRRPINQAMSGPKYRGTLPSLMQRSYSPSIQYQLQKKGAESNPVAPNIESSIQSSRGGGRTLSPGERSYFEPRFGTSFAGVKIHTDSSAAQLSRSVNARAFTVGRDIFFGSGEYRPHTGEGRKLMAHELTHTVQQGGGVSIMRVFKTLKPPGDCTNMEHFYLQSQVDVHCKSGIGCKGTDSCPVLFEKMGMHAKCIQARAVINAKCFRGGDQGHTEALESHIGGLQRCWKFYESKCKDWKPPVKVPVPEEKSEKKPIVDDSFMKKMEDLTGLTGAALIIYLIISEGSRLFPLRNLVPVP